MRHLYPSVGEVMELIGRSVAGSLEQKWARVDEIFDASHDPGFLACRLDLQFLRPGKDQPAPWAAGRAPDRVGLLFCDPTTRLKAGQRIRMVEGPISGTFALHVIPDLIVSMRHTHHIEVQVIEVAQNLAGNFPGRETGT